jgi:hypothetical protein
MICSQRYRLREFNISFIGFAVINYWCLRQISQQIGTAKRVSTTIFSQIQDNGMNMLLFYFCKKAVDEMPETPNTIIKRKRTDRTDACFID